MPSQPAALTHQADSPVQPFLKWPGGKRWLVPQLAPLLRESLRNCYFEPFLGSGAMHLAVQSPRAVLSDINEELIVALSVIASDPEKVVAAVWRFTNTADCYYRVRRSQPRSEIGVAARFLYLNRTAWGGVHRLNRLGEFNTPFGNSGRVICRLKSVVEGAALFARAELRSADFEEIIDQAGNGDVVYADPPYVGPGSGHDNFKRYTRESFNWGDQLRLAAAAQRAAERGALVVVSGRASFGIEGLYPHWQALHVRRSCNVSRRTDARGAFDEVVLTSPNITEWRALSTNRSGSRPAPR
jgi:DNA adenine methylase